MSQSELSGRTLSRAGNIPRVLVIDDEADLRELIELTLVGMGLDVDCSADLADARARLGRNAYSLCLTDMRLPDGDGLELVKLIATDYPNTPVAVITAFGSTENAVAALKAGAFDYPRQADRGRRLAQSRAFGGQSAWRRREDGPGVGLGGGIASSAR